MNVYVKLALSIAALFIAGSTTCYQSNANASPLALVMAGLASVGGYLIGFLQLNPYLKRPGDAPDAPRIILPGG